MEKFKRVRDFRIYKSLKGEDTWPLKVINGKEGIVFPDGWKDLDVVKELSKTNLIEVVWTYDDESNWEKEEEETDSGKLWNYLFENSINKEKEVTSVGGESLMIGSITFKGKKENFLAWYGDMGTYFFFPKRGNLMKLVRKGF